MKLVPLGDRVVLKQVDVSETTASGIVLPGKTKERPAQAIVMAVGPGKEENGKLTTMNVKVNDMVVYSRYAGTEVKIGEEEYIVIGQGDILAILED